MVAKNFRNIIHIRNCSKITHNYVGIDRICLSC